MSDFSQQFPVVFGALNEGFLQTLKLFAITLAGALPLGLVIYFGEVNSWAPFAALARRQTKTFPKLLPKNRTYCHYLTLVSFLI